MSSGLNPFAFFGHLKIGVKIMVGYVAALALAAIVGGLAIFQLGRVNTTVTRLTGQLSQERELAEEMTVQIYRIRLYANQYIYQGQNPAVLDSYNQALASAQAILNRGDQVITEGNRVAMQAQMRANFNQFAAAFAEIVQLLSKRQTLVVNTLIPQYADGTGGLASLRNDSYQKLDLTSVNFASQALDLFNQLQVNASQFQASGDEGYSAQTATYYKLLGSTLDLLNASVQSEAARRQVSTIAGTAAAYYDGFTQITSLVAQQQAQVTGQLDVYGPAVEQNATQIANSINIEFAAQSQETDRIFNRTRIGVLMTILAVVAVGLLFGLALSRVITQPIRRVAHAAQGIAAGALDQEVPVQGDDELGILSEAFNHMTTQLRETIAKMTRSAEELHEARLLYENIVRLSPEIIVVVSEASGRYLAVSEAHERVTGYRPDEVIGHSVTEFKIWETEEDRERIMRIVHEKGRLYNVEQRFYRRSGELYTALLSIARVDVGGKWYLINIVTDITERKKAEEEVRRLNAELEQRVIERTQQLETTNKELESFSYSISHDLRAPLRAIDGFSRILQEDYGSDLTTDMAELVLSIRASARTMGRLIDDLLRFSRLSRQPVDKHKVDTGVMVNQALQTLEPELEGRQVEIDRQELLPCRGDPVLLLQVWVNLLSNAFKFTRQREIAHIQIGCQDGEDGKPVYYVRDDGVGFDMNYADKLFGVFQRLHSAQEFEGTGVGLALVQRIIQRHGGRIWAEARPGEGATFYFTVG